MIYISIDYVVCNQVVKTIKSHSDANNHYIRSHINGLYFPAMYYHRFDPFQWIDELMYIVIPVYICDGHSTVYSGKCLNSCSSTSLLATFREQNKDFFQNDYLL